MTDTTSREGGALASLEARLAAIAKPLDDIAWVALRVATGLMLMPHGAQKLFGLFGGGGISGTAGFLESVGYPAPTLMALLIGLVEFFGGLMLVTGFLTRFAAVAVAVFMAFAVAFHLGNGFFWTARGYEYPLLWGITAVFFAVKGGGPLSIDAGRRV
ncbi:DoxX family protein [Loktanella sp. IMCC34160]|uniref:DoxX family protein n=1 Tax=Loktanella sp. IMCC34160 TaxID=2510646 RepID=UPI00101CF2D1|nr:DoxX family protein [Loktanella sp. IMCC34160]RYG91773.1 DoxX family protein [Loktanella sp. IMCC34160]